MDLVSTLPLLGVMAASAYGAQHCHLHVQIVQKFCEPHPPGVLKACRDQHRHSFTLSFVIQLLLI